MEPYSILTTLPAAAITASTAILLPALGEGLSQRSGTLNIGVEGYMLVGALTGYFTLLYYENTVLAFILAMFAGFLLSLIHSFFTVTLKCSQIVSGTGIWLFGFGLTSYVYRLVNVVEGIAKLKVLPIIFLSEIPLLGPIIFKQNIMVYIAYLLVPVFAVLLYRTPWGLIIRGVGDSPLSTDMSGYNVYFIRYACISICGMMAGLGGAYLSIGSLSQFSEGLTAGKGFIAIAIVTFGSWDPIKILIGALFFSIIDATQLYLQASGSTIPFPLLIIMPYVLTVIVLSITSKRAKNIPRKLTIPYIRGEE